MPLLLSYSSTTRLLAGGRLGETPLYYPQLPASPLQYGETPLCLLSGVNMSLSTASRVTLFSFWLLCSLNREAGVSQGTF